MEQQEEVKCENCNLPFNTVGRAMIMLPCGHQVCCTCIQKLLQPQDTKFQCPLCQESIQITDRLKQNLAKMQAKSATLNIYCKAHPEALAEHFCKEHNALICIKCAFSGHADHQNKVVEVKRQHTDSLLDYAFEHLLRMKNEIITICDRISLYKSDEQGFISDEFLTIVKDIQALVTPHLNTQQEKDQLQFMKVQELQIQQAQQPPQPEVLQFDAHAQNTFKITIEEQRLFQQWIGNKSKFQLLFRGSKDTFKQKAFGGRCYNNGPLLVIIKSQHQKVYGFYTSKYIPPNFQSIKDPNLFIFSLTNKTKHVPQNSDLNHVQSDNAFYFFLIGASRGSIYLYDECNKKSDNGGLFNGNDFVLPYEQMDRKLASQYLSGSEKFNDFTILEVEAYKVIAQP